MGYALGVVGRRSPSSSARRRAAWSCKGRSFSCTGSGAGARAVNILVEMQKDGAVERDQLHLARKRWYTEKENY